MEKSIARFCKMNQNPCDKFCIMVRLTKNVAGDALNEHFYTENGLELHKPVFGAERIQTSESKLSEIYIRSQYI